MVQAEDWLCAVYVAGTLVYGPTPHPSPDACWRACYAEAARYINATPLCGRRRRYQMIEMPAAVRDWIRQPAAWGQGD